MPNWTQVLEEIVIKAQSSTNAVDEVRRKYLGLLQKKTGRNVIAYYSGFLQKPGYAFGQVNDDDKNGFMNAVHGLDRSQGLDLILHTPGGDLSAAESIVHYLRQMYGTDIRAVIPQLAMSAGTMIACACSEIIMGKQSNIGPFDPQFGGIPAHGVLEEFDNAIEAVKRDPGSTPIWQAIINKYHPTFLGECEKAIELADLIVKNWLVSGMFKGDADAVAKADNIVLALNDHAGTKTHSRHLHVEDAVGFGLKVVKLEDDEELQDLVLTVHHAYMHTFANSPAGKIIENHNGSAIVLFSQ
ncbi:SDH family Clp fold serine proteinase [Pseudomonas simiae]|uniref:SDH family Clp fold serine proteinase n=1 Tax=Pseudomonas simiae TaxID=321846 RepID=UPI0005C3ECD7|nr:serine protease [Pseudomonas simiae]AJP51114.1 serine protease [Pseudomonas simiae]